MDRIEVFDKLTDIFRMVMANDDIVLEEETTVDDIDEWDSLTHYQLIEKIEADFGIKFSAYEITSWIDVSEMVDCIQKKLS